ncbi:MAG: T9SS type A sorting domain-containing protein [Deltaproteobacteria bacterium]|nr:T9SS type A sorting domain-containing protein [Deltaproteobacteria bacterium]
MKKAILLTLIMMLSATTAFSADFAPTLLKLSADPVINYDFDGSDLDIPVQVSGTTAGIIFCVFTKEEAENIPFTHNGNLGWHMVNKIDTCVFYSTLKGFSVGANTITWDGKDQDGGVVPAGEYTYYLWDFDNLGTKQLVGKSIDSRICHDYRNEIQEIDENGLPIANPIIFGGTPTYGWPGPPFRWIIGNDPLDETLLATSNIPMTEGWGLEGDEVLHPTDFNYFYVKVRNTTSLTAGIQKFKWVPGGDCEMQSDFGNEGFSELHSTNGGGGQGPGVASDGEYLFACDENHWASNEPDSDFYIYDYDGYIISEIDLTTWWSNPDNFEAGAQMNGGPINFTERNGLVVLNAHASCMNNLVDPAGYLENDDIDDFWLWASGNGDYVLDHNFEDTAAIPWACNDYNVGPYKTSVATDANYFTLINAYGIGTISFGLLAPDGTGLGYFLFAGDTAGLKGGTLIVDSGTAFDGIYTDNQHTGGTRFERNEEKADQGLFFLGHDTISGVITNSVGVAEEAPAAFTVEQNAPNPFNPTTTITFSLEQAGDVSVDVLNVAGQRIDTLVDGFMDAGSHSAVWNASGFSAGVYFYTVKSGGHTKTMKMTLLK